MSVEEAYTENMGAFKDLLVKLRDTSIINESIIVLNNESANMRNHLGSVLVSSKNVSLSSCTLLKKESSQTVSLAQLSYLINYTGWYFYSYR